ncbi:MAG: ATP-binding cassette domain-containing protein [Clostridium sp.]
MSAIQVKQVVKQYKNGVQALNGISLCVEQGEIFSLLGQNGAGKSTLLRILTTYLQPTSGRITMLRKDLCRDAASLRSQIACVAQQTSIDTYLSLEENMLLQSRLYRIPKGMPKNGWKRSLLISVWSRIGVIRYPLIPAV